MGTMLGDLYLIVRLPDMQLNPGEMAAIMGSLRRMPSGNLYEGFPCVRVGDYLLPSSMDLRAFSWGQTLPSILLSSLRQRLFAVI